MVDEKTMAQVIAAVEEMKAMGRYDDLLRLIGVPTLLQLNIQAAKARLSPFVITVDFRFWLPAYQKEVELAPIHKALYIFFLRHTEGVEFKHLRDYREELLEIYRRICNRTSQRVMESSIDRLVNPLDNSINEKCARIKSAFASFMDVYQLSYYAISSHTVRHVDGTSHVWFERKKAITLQRELVKFE